MTNVSYTGFVVLVLSVGVLLMSPSSYAGAANPVADANIVVSQENTSTGYCVIAVEPQASAKCSAPGRAEDICVSNNTNLTFSLGGGRSGEFYIVPDPFQNPLFADGGQGTCKARSNNGSLKCKVSKPGNESSNGYKFWVFVDGCAQPLDPRIYVN
ncbi:MAG: hypothetical protein O7G86_10935 [Gammaproteobacteria bacterium]|nr:hypothetical protein [Gammaproteobacteria bacterium]